MTVISKNLFYKKIGSEIGCDQIHFWDPNCFKGGLYFSCNAFIGSLKFFLPIYIIKAIIHRKKLKDKQYVKRLLLEEVRSGCYGFFMGMLFLSSNCVLSKLCGRINYYNVGLISGMVAGLAVLVETKENKVLDTLIFFNSVVEAIFRNIDQYVVKITPLKETLLFMTASCLLMYMLQNRKENLKYTTFWFFTPRKYEVENNKLEYKCNHKESCVEYTFEGIQKYFMLGYAFSVVKQLIPKMIVVFQKPKKLLDITLNKENVKFGMFIGAYVGIYRYVICYLLTTKKTNPKYYGGIAGLISGAMYGVSPDVRVLSVAITTLLQINYNNVLSIINIKNQFIPQQIVFMLSLGLLIHNVVASKETCPSYFINMLNSCTNNTFLGIYENIVTKHILS